MEEVWKFFFDEAYSKEGTGVGFILIAPGGNMFPFSFKLEFEATNNVVEYEALLHVLLIIEKKKIKALMIFRDT